MENGVTVRPQSEQKAKCLQLFTEIANRSYENIFKPADSREKMENEGSVKIDKNEFDFDNNYGQRLLACTQHHYNCIMLYRKYFTLHEDCVSTADSIKAKTSKLVEKNKNKILTYLTVKHINDLLSEIEDWREKLDHLHDTSLTVPSVKKRLSETCSTVQVEVIYAISEDENYEVQSILEPNRRITELGAEEGEKLTLIDNSNKMFWTVKNRHGETGEIPSLFLSNCAPDSTLIRKSSRLEDEFSATVRKVMHLLEQSPETTTQIKELRRQYGRMLLSAAKRNKDTKPMPRSPILSRAQSRESLDKVDEKVIEIKTTITEVTVVEDTTCYAPEYSEYYGQEVQMFLISGVIDPRDFQEISIDEARRYGIVDTKQGVYHNIETGETIPISDAMEQGLILVEKSVRKKQKEKETKRRARSYEDLL